MQIISNESMKGFGFEHAIVFTAALSDIDSKLDEVVAICEWASYNFAHNFVILATATKIIAGGAVDNAQSWAEQWNADNSYHVTGTYELRGSMQDLCTFTLKFQSEKT